MKMPCQCTENKNNVSVETKRVIQTLEQLELAVTLDSSPVLLWSLEILGITLSYHDFASLNLPNCNKSMVLH